MSAYTTKTKVLAEIPNTRLAQLTAEAPATSPDDDIVTAAITEVSSDMDGYICGVAALPVTDTVFLAILDPICVILTKALLYGRRTFSLADTDVRRYDAAMKKLEAWQLGQAQIPPSATRPSAPTSTGGSVLWASDAQVFIEDDTSEDSAY